METERFKKLCNEINTETLDSLKSILKENEDYNGFAELLGIMHLFDEMNFSAQFLKLSKEQLYGIVDLIYKK